MTQVSDVRFQPMRVVAVDLASGEVEYPDPAHRPDHARARALVRWASDPIGFVEVDAGDDLLTAVSEAAWQELRAELTRMVTSRGLPTPGSPADLVLPAEQREAGHSLPEGPRPLATVAIASFRNVASTVDCVHRVLRSCWNPLEVVVVDNDADHTPLATALEEAFGDDGRVRTVHEPRQGLSFARNAGLAAAHGELVVFTDDDVLVDEHWVERLVTAFDLADDVACVTGAIMPAELEAPAQYLLEEYGGFHKGFERQVFNATTHRRDTPLYPYDAGQFGSGANMAFKAEVLRGLGGFAVDLGAGTRAYGGEDLDVLRRTVTSGHTVVYEPAAILWHKHRRSYEALRRQMFRYGVGLSATVTRWLLEDPRTALAVVRRLPRGLLHLLSPASEKNRSKSTDFPRLLSALEVAGVVVGPIAYLRSRRRVARLATPA